MTRLAEYADWLADVVPAFMGDEPTYVLNAAAFDKGNHEAIFFATFAGFRDIPTLKWDPKSSSLAVYHEQIIKEFIHV